MMTVEIVPSARPLDDGDRTGDEVATGTPATPDDELRLLEALRRGDEAAFAALLDSYQASMIRIAMLYAPNWAVAEEVVQETWLGVLRGLERFEGRSSLKTWIFRILMNRAKTRAEREGRTVPFSSLWDRDAEAAEPAVEPSRFRDAEPWKDHWASPVRGWGDAPEEQLLSGETREQIRQAIDVLPPVQREVITLRDIEGWTSAEVCDVLNLSEGNQRVLLHRARSKVRRALERYLTGE